MSDLAYKISVMQAAERGEEIECSDFGVTYNGMTQWRPSIAKGWNWVSYEYRVKPKPREWTVFVGKDNSISSPCLAAICDGGRQIRVREVIE